MSFQSQNMQSEKCLESGTVCACLWLREMLKKSPKLVCFPYAPELASIKSCSRFLFLALQTDS